MSHNTAGDGGELAAKLDVPGAMHEYHSTGPIMARKL